MIDFELVVDEMIIAARAAILDGEVLELEPCQFSDCMIHVMEKLRQAEKDAARYRWLRDEAIYTHDLAPLVFMTDINGELDGSVSDCVLREEGMDAAIDEAMNGSNN